MGDPAGGLQLKSAESKVVSVTLAQNADLKVTLPADKISLGTDCSSSLSVNVQNSGDAPAAVQLVGDDKLKGLVDSDPQNVPAKGSAALTVNITAPSKKGAVSGKIRARLTDSGDAFTIDATDPEELRVSPSQLDERVQPGAQVSKQFTIENSGRAGEARDIKALITGDFQTLNPQVSFADSAPLKPRQQKILTVEFNAPGAEGKTVGVMIVSSACTRIQIPLSVTVQNR